MLRKKKVLTYNSDEPGIAGATDTAGMEEKGIVKEKPATMHVTLQLRFHTVFGQSVFITGKHELFGHGDISKALPMQYFDDEHWTVTLTFREGEYPDEEVNYNYVVRNTDGSLDYDWSVGKIVNFTKLPAKDTLIIDSWNHAGYYENAFYTEPFQRVLLKDNLTAVPVKDPALITHTLRVKAPLLQKGEALCVLGGTKTLNNWDVNNPVLMHRTPEEDYWQVKLDLSKDSFPLAYKYGIYNYANKTFITYEHGSNRILYDAAFVERQTIVNDGFVVLPDDSWKGAGIAIPVFSLRSAASFGVGEFTDIRLLVDWAKQTGLKLIQLLPVNDTTATHTWTDSYPYAAISAFALHPVYLNVSKVAGDVNTKAISNAETERKRLNLLDKVDYETVMNLKWQLLKEIYPLQRDTTFASSAYTSFFDQNSHWLIPYAVFCYLRDKYKTSDFNQWPEHSQYKTAEITALAANTSAVYDEIAFHYFIQYHLHQQLQEATAYAHEKGIVLKGDIPIGIYRYGVDAWQKPGLYHMDVQAGAPPDDFAVKGQNWGFPTYNWERMHKDDFAWWKQRFEQMSYYFDAFRIDHILGFFRIWSIPLHAVEGIMGHFAPAIPVHISEFYKQGVQFNHARFVDPFINDQVLWEEFGANADYVKENYLDQNASGLYELKEAFNTQRAVEKYFGDNPGEDRVAIRDGLYNLISNVVLFADDRAPEEEFHFRFAMDKTSSFRYLDGHEQYHLKELYQNYFFQRQDDYWKHEALQKLPALKRVTNMLICGEDLGLVPACVPDVMKQLGILSLEIQRMPKLFGHEFFHPANAPYLSVITPSTHDMSTVRGWWEEDKEKTQRFFNIELQQPGEAPAYCEPWINKAIILQHLYSPAMWSIFQLQDLLGMDGSLRRENPQEERINVPANPKHYWRYRMHLTLEALLQADEFNNNLLNFVHASGRG